MITDQQGLTVQRRILLAEDNPINQKIAQVMLQRLGGEVTIAENGQEARDLAKDNHYEMIFMDCQMPVMDGYQATEAIRHHTGINQHTPIIALTAHAMEGDKEKCLAAGMNDYITKPYNIETLRDVIQKWTHTPC